MDGVTDTLWEFFQGNQRSVKCIAAYIGSFPCGETSRVYKLENQRCINKAIFQVQGHVSCVKHGLIPHCRYINKVATENPFAKDVHIIVSYIHWGICLISDFPTYLTCKNKTACNFQMTTSLNRMVNNTKSTDSSLRPKEIKLPTEEAPCPSRFRATFACRPTVYLR